MRLRADGRLRAVVRVRPAVVRLRAVVVRLRAVVERLNWYITLPVARTSAVSQRLLNPLRRGG